MIKTRKARAACWVSFRVKDVAIEKPIKKGELNSRFPVKKDFEYSMNFTMKKGLAPNIWVLVFMICLGACSKKNGASVFPNSNSDIYAGGFDGNYAVIWKNQEEIKLTDGKNKAQVMGISVSGKDLYAVGYEMSLDGHHQAVIWKNGVERKITDGKTEGIATSVQFTRGNLYIGLMETNGKGVSQVKLWKNGSVFPVSSGEFNAQVNSILVHGKDIYMAGGELNEWGNSIAKYWKNGKEISLSDGKENEELSSIAIQNGKIIATGSLILGDHTQGRIWINGNPMDLTEGPGNGGLGGISPQGNDLFLVGFENGFATLWVNRKPIQIGNGIDPSFLEAISFSGKKWVVGGDEFNGKVTVAKYWADGKSIPLSDGTQNSSISSLTIQ